MRSLFFANIAKKINYATIFDSFLEKPSLFDNTEGKGLGTY